MFNDKYGLTAAVLQGRKTMTRRIESGMENLEEGNFCFLKRKQEIEIYGEKGTIIETIKPRYQVGEVVAIAQSYKDAGYTKEWVVQNVNPNPNAKPTDPFEKRYPGWTNKMFVKDDLMLHRIRITDIKIERPHDISDDDCIMEGIIRKKLDYTPDGYPKGLTYYGFYGWGLVSYSAKDAFAALIDKVSGRGTWKANPWVFAYSYELVK